MSRYADAAVFGGHVIFALVAIVLFTLDVAAAQHALTADAGSLDEESWIEWHNRIGE